MPSSETEIIDIIGIIELSVVVKRQPRGKTTPFPMKENQAENLQLRRRRYITLPGARPQARTAAAFRGESL